MSGCYTADDQQRIRMQAQVRAWGRAGLLQADQASALDSRLRTTLRRTNGFLRAALALFTALIVAAFVRLVFVALNISQDPGVVIGLVVAAAACVVAAEFVITSFRVYRYGVEEALAVGAVILIAFAVGHEARAFSVVNSATVTTMAVAICGFALYLRFGFVYAAIAAMICAALIPFAVELSEAVQRTTAAAIAGVAVVWARALKRRAGDAFPGDDYATIQAAAVAVIYVVSNLHALDAFGGTPSPPVAAWFYWGSYAVTWLLPAAGLAMAIRDKDRPLLIVAVASALATLATNKAYLGWPRQTWDPILFGALLVAVATVLRRWLASGPNGQRHGFTAERILESDRDALTAIATASAGWPRHGVHAPRPSEPPPSQFEGGRSGGGGGGAAY
jgi:hypothetical protein